MAQFKFKLQPVLDQRAREEKLVQRELAERQGDVLRLEGELKALEREVLSANGFVRDESAAGRLGVGLLQQHRRYLFGVRGRVGAVVDGLGKARLAREAAVRKVADAARQRRTVELLRDKQKERWTEGEHRRELALQDDVNTTLGHEWTMTP